MRRTKRYENLISEVADILTFIKGNDDLVSKALCLIDRENKKGNN